MPIWDLLSLLTVCFINMWGKINRQVNMNLRLVNLRGRERGRGRACRSVPWLYSKLANIKTYDVTSLCSLKLSIMNNLNIPNGCQLRSRFEEWNITMGSLRTVSRLPSDNANLAQGDYFRSPLWKPHVTDRRIVSPSSFLILTPMSMGILRYTRIVANKKGFPQLSTIEQS